MVCNVCRVTEPEAIFKAKCSKLCIEYVNVINHLVCIVMSLWSCIWHVCINIMK